MSHFLPATMSSIQLARIFHSYCGRSSLPRSSKSLCRGPRGVLTDSYRPMIDKDPFIPGVLLFNLMYKHKGRIAQFSLNVKS